jgi:hypothetical protein
MTPITAYIAEVRTRISYDKAYGETSIALNLTDLDKLTRALELAVNALKTSQKQQNYWAKEIIDFNVPIEHQSKRLKENGANRIKEILEQIEEVLNNK